MPKLARDRLARMITQTREQVQNRRGRPLCCASARAVLRLLFGLFSLNWEPPSAGTWISPAQMALPSSRAVDAGGFQIPRKYWGDGSTQPWRRSERLRGLRGSANGTNRVPVGHRRELGEIERSGRPSVVELLRRPRGSRGRGVEGLTGVSV